MEGADGVGAGAAEPGVEFGAERLFQRGLDLAFDDPLGLLGQAGESGVEGVCRLTSGGERRSGYGVGDVA